MKKYVSAGGAVLAAVVAGVALLITSGGNSTPTPTHVVAQFVDGLNNGDLRQVCATLEKKTLKKDFGNRVHCEQYWIQNLAQGIFFGYWSGYVVVAHSAKVDGDKATAEFKYKASDHVLHVSLLKTKNGWKITDVRAS